MASSLTTITTTKSLATCVAITLAGPIKLVAEGMVAADEVIVYEETATEDNYQIVPETQTNAARLTSRMPSILFEGYGKYKFLLKLENPAMSSRLG